MRTGAPPAPPPGRHPAKLQSPLHHTTTGVFYPHIHRTAATPPPPVGTCALCQHFGVFYCGYKRVSPSEPLSNNTGPLCWLKNKSNFPLFRSSRIDIYVYKYMLMCIYIYNHICMCVRRRVVVLYVYIYKRILYDIERIVLSDWTRKKNHQIIIICIQEQR